MHEFSADEYEECWEILCQSFSFAGFCPLRPTYDSWFVKQSALSTYRRYADILRLISVNTPSKHWLLKSPYHLHAIEALREVFPDACIIQTHRDPLKSIPSNCSLLAQAQRGMEGEASQPKNIGPQELVHWRAALDGAEASRRRCPARYFDVDHRQCSIDPLASVRAIYDYFGLTLSSGSEQRMRCRVTHYRPAALREHRYMTDTYGITESQIREAFHDYRARLHFD
jgi:hypothetical protein